jgi:hypothetical protein
MDYRCAADFLVDYLHAVEKCGELPVLTKERRAAIRSLNESVPMVNAILAALAPDLGSVTGGTYLRDHQSGVSRIQRALNLISGWPEVPARTANSSASICRWECSTPWSARPPSRNRRLAGSALQSATRALP